MNDAGKLRIGILGTGRMAHSFATGLIESHQAKLAAVGSRHESSAKQFAEKFDCAPHSSYEAVAGDPYVDLVYVATPHSLHSQHCLLSLDAGKAVLCEKPFAINALEANAVIEAARRKNLFLMEAMWTRFLPAICRLRDLLEAGTIGRPAMVVGGGAFMPPYEPENYLFRPDLGGGVLLDAGVYLLSLTSMMLGAPIETLATGTISEHGVDDHDAILLRHQNGAVANLYVSLKASASPEMTIYGDRGHIHIHAPIFAPSKLSVKAGDEPEKHLDLPYAGNGYHYQVDAAAQCIANGNCESDVMPLSETLSVITTMDEIRNQIGLRYPMES